METGVVHWGRKENLSTELHTWQVPRDDSYSIRNVLASGTCRQNCVVDLDLASGSFYPATIGSY